VQLIDGDTNQGDGVDLLLAEAGRYSILPRSDEKETARPGRPLVLAARREEEPGRFRELRIGPRRLARMKESLTHELESQRGERTRERSMSHQLFRSAARDGERGDDHNHDLLRRRTRPERARPER